MIYFIITIIILFLIFVLSVFYYNALLKREKEPKIINVLKNITTMITYSIIWVVVIIMSVIFIKEGKYFIIVFLLGWTFLFYLSIRNIILKDFDFDINNLFGKIK